MLLDACIRKRVLSAVAVHGTVRIRAAVEAEIASHCASAPDAEVCGLLAGCDSIITTAYPARNATPDIAIAYEIAPEELFRLMRAIRADGLEFLGIYHSHPQTVNKPSVADIERAYYPDVAYFIFSVQSTPQPLRAFTIREGKAVELQIEIVD